MFKTRLKSTEANPRALYLDVVRAVACLMVVVIHAPMPNIGTPGNVLSSVSLLMAPCVPLFFMVSGALLLPSSLGMGDFMRRRLGRVLWPTLGWTAFYIVLNTCKGGAISELPRVVASVAFSPQGNGIMWFMYAVVGLYLITPIISPWLQCASRREVEAVLILWAVTLCFPTLSRWVEVSRGAEGTWYYFSGFAGYYLLGYYLHRFQPKAHWSGVLVLLLAPVGAAWMASKACGGDVDFYTEFWYLSLPDAMMTTAWFLLLRRLSAGMSAESRMARVVVNFSKQSFTIYLMHIFVMRALLWNLPIWEACGGIVQILLTSLLTVAICWGVSVAWSASHRKFVAAKS